MKKHLLLFFLAILQVSLFAQHPSVRQVGFTMGFAYKAVKSDAYSSRTLSGIGVPLGLFYQTINDRNRHTIDVGFLAAKPSESYNTSVDDISGHISYDYLKSAYNWRNMRFYAGFSAGASGGMRQYITRNLPNNNTAFEGNLTLDAAIMAEYQREGKRLTGQINYTLIGYQYATLYAFAYQDTRLLTPANLTQITGSLRFLSPISKRFNLRAGYAFSLFSSPTPQYLGLLKHQFDIALCYQF